MRLREVLPWNWGKKEVPVRREASRSVAESASPTPRTLFDLLDELRFGSFNVPAFPTLSDFGDEGGFLPALDARETDEEIRIKVELPGMDEKDVEVALKEDVLTIRGEKQDETKHEEEGAQWVERRFGSFRRVIPLPPDVDVDGVKAHFKAGVLTVNVPRTGRREESHRSIPIEVG
jgi:HSP20 family protein